MTAWRIFVLNLPSKTMMGIESQGMLFDIGYARENSS